MAKLLVGFVYQLIISTIVLLIAGGIVGQVALLVFFTLLGACFGLVLGLFASCLLNAASFCRSF